MYLDPSVGSSVCQLFVITFVTFCSTFDRLCQPLDKDNVNDVATFALDLSGNFAIVVQYNKDNRAFEV